MRSFSIFSLIILSWVSLKNAMDSRSFIAIAAMEFKVQKNKKKSWCLASVEMTSWEEDIQRIFITCYQYLCTVYWVCWQTGERLLLQNMGVVNLLNMGYFKLSAHAQTHGLFLLASCSSGFLLLEAALAAHPWASECVKGCIHSRQPAVLPWNESAKRKVNSAGVSGIYPQPEVCWEGLKLFALNVVSQRRLKWPQHFALVPSPANYHPDPPVSPSHPTSPWPERHPSSVEFTPAAN